MDVTDNGVGELGGCELGPENACWERPGGRQGRRAGTLVARQQRRRVYQPFHHGHQLGRQQLLERGVEEGAPPGRRTQDGEGVSGEEVRRTRLGCHMGVADCKRAEGCLRILLMHRSLSVDGSCTTRPEPRDKNPTFCFSRSALLDLCRARDESQARAISKATRKQSTLVSVAISPTLGADLRLLSSVAVCALGLPA